MKFEKINNDKIKVTLNIEDLTNKNIDMHSFMSDSDETHSLFLDVLQKAEEDYNFSTKNYNLKVETLALSDGDFILTITRVLDSVNLNTNNIKKQLHVSRKIPNATLSTAIYKFASFDDFCSFVFALSNNPLFDYKKISKGSALYQYNDYYYLVLININIKYIHLKSVFSLITEFATYINSSDLLLAKLHEVGKPIFKTKALYNCIKYFIN